MSHFEPPSDGTFSTSRHGRRPKMPRGGGGGETSENGDGLLFGIDKWTLILGGIAVAGGVWWFMSRKTAAESQIPQTVQQEQEPQHMPSHAMAPKLPQSPIAGNPLVQEYGNNAQLNNTSQHPVHSPAPVPGPSSMFNGGPPGSHGGRQQQMQQQQQQQMQPAATVPEARSGTNVQMGTGPVAGSPSSLIRRPGEGLPTSQNKLGTGAVPSSGSYQGYNIVSQ